MNVFRVVGSRWAAPLFVLLLALPLIEAGCGRFSSENPGVEGKIELGAGLFASSSARRIVIALFKEEDFNIKKEVPVEKAKPLYQTILTSLSTPPYPYHLETRTLTGRVFLFAFLDQDDSGGDLPTPGDLYGTYNNNGNPIDIGVYRLTNITITLDNKFAKPPIEIEITLGGVTPSKEAKRMVFGFWRVADVDDSIMPKPKTQPLLYYDKLDPSQDSWVFKMDVGQRKEHVHPFVFVDEDNSGGLLPTKGDFYGTWDKAPISFEEPPQERIKLILKNVYQP